MPLNSSIASCGTPLNHRTPDSQYWFNSPQMLTFYPNLGRSPVGCHPVACVSGGRNFDGGSCQYRLLGLREGYNSNSKLQQRPKNIVKITNPETGDNIFHELEKERNSKTFADGGNDRTKQVESGEVLHSANPAMQQPSIPNSTSEESASPKTFSSHGCFTSGSCESNSMLTNSSSSSRPPSVSLTSPLLENCHEFGYDKANRQNGSVHPRRSFHAPRPPYVVIQQTQGGGAGHALNFGNGHNGPGDVNEKQGFHDPNKSMYFNHPQMMIPTFNCQPPYIPPQSQQMAGARLNGYYNLPRTFYDHSSYYYDGESMQPYFSHNASARGYRQMHSRVRPVFRGDFSVNQMSQSGSHSNSSEELNLECDTPSSYAKLDKPSTNEEPTSMEVDYCEGFIESNSDGGAQQSVATLRPGDDGSAGGTPDDCCGKLNAEKNENRQGVQANEHKEITLDPNAKSFVFSGILPARSQQRNESLVCSSQFSARDESANSFLVASPDAQIRAAGKLDAFTLQQNNGFEMKRFSSRGSNMDHMDCEPGGRSKKGSISTTSGSFDAEDSKESAKMFRSGSDGGILEKNLMKLQNGTSERRNTDGSIGKSGRIQYSREFLLNLQFEPDSLKTPKGLTVFPEIIQNGKGSDVNRWQYLGAGCHQNVPLSNLHQMSSNNQGFPHSASMPLAPAVHPSGIMPPCFSQQPIMAMGGSCAQQQFHDHHSTANVGRQLKGKSYSQHQSAQQPPRKVIQVCLGQNVQLHQCDNAWKPTGLVAVKKEDVVDSNEIAIVELYRKVRGILNKLTPQKFDTLIQQVHNLSINTEEKLKGCIKLIFEKAIGEPSFSLAYAQMAKSLNNLKVFVDNRPGETVTFRKLLLNQCQKEFEKDKLEELDLEKMSKQIERASSDKEKQQLLEAKKEAEKIAKKRSIGNIRFIGELFKLKMLTEHIMYDCIGRLLKYADDEDNVECLCRLLATIGKDLDNASPTSKQRLNHSLHELKRLSDEHQLSSRIRFMIQDVLELRESEWIPRREDNKPKLIEQIHKEAEMEEMHKRHQLNSQQPHQHKTHHQHLQPSASASHELQRSSSLASSSVEHPRCSADRGSFPTELRSQSINQHCQHHYQGRGSIDRNIRQNADRFGSLERVKPSDNFSGGGNGNNKINVYATLGHTRRYSARPLTGGGNSISSSDLGKTLDTLRNENSSVQLAPSSFKMQQKPWQEGSSGGAMRHVLDPGSSPLPPTALRSRGSSSDIYARSYNRSPVRIAPRSRVIDPKSIEREKHAAIAAAKSISSSASADSFINPTSSNKLPRDQLVRPNAPARPSPHAVSLSQRDLANQQKDLERKCHSLLEEYLVTDDLQEACLAFKELRSSVKGNTCQLLVLTNYLVNDFLKKPTRDRQKISVLLSHLALKNLVTVEVYLESISSVLKDAHDISIDIPKILDYLAELASRAILGKVFSFGNLSTLCLALCDQEKQREFIGHVIRTTTAGFDAELNMADQPNFVADLVIFLSNLSSNGKGDNSLIDEDMLRAHSDQLRRCFNSADMEWPVLMLLKKEIYALVDEKRAPNTLSSLVGALQKSEVLSNSTVARWKSSPSECK